MQNTFTSPTPEGCSQTGNSTDSAELKKAENLKTDVAAEDAKTPVIVVGVDGSDNCQAALEWALDRAKVAKARVHVVCIYTLPSYAVASFDSAYVPLDDGVLEASAQVVVDNCVEQARKQGVVASGALETGDPLTALLELSKLADLMVIGARHGKGLAERLLGRVSASLPVHSRCPVVVVPVAPDGHKWTPVKTIVVGSDGIHPSRGALGAAMREAACWGAKLTAFSAFHPTSAAWVPVIGKRETQVEDVRAGLRAAVGAAASTVVGGKELQVDSHALEGDPAQLICEFSTATDLVVVGSRNRSGFKSIILGSTAQTVLQYADCPVMVVPSDAHKDTQINPADVPWRRL